MKIDEITKLFNLGRPIIEDKGNPYLYLAKKYNFTNYRLISSGELLIRGKDLDIPDYIKQFMKFNNEALMIANIMNNKVISVVFRNLSGKKEFMKLGITKSTFYGLGQLDPNFRYGVPILLVEGHLDRDRMSLLFKNTLGVMTNAVSESQANLLKGLTDKVYLKLDNDEAGKIGTNKTKKLLSGMKVIEVKHDDRLKDAGDLVKLEMENYYDLKFIEDYYKIQLA